MNINVTTSDSCKVIVQDLGEYQDEDSTVIAKGKFKFSETISIDVLLLNKTDGAVYSTPVYTPHSESDTAEIDVGFDGWFTVIHLVLPTEEWFTTQYNKSSGSALSLYSLVYYSDGTSIYKYSDGTVSEVDIEEVVEVNPDDTTIQSATSDYVSICFLRKCYINYCQQIFESRALTQCFNDSDVDSELVYKRDLVWMAINVIKYLTECEQLAEVERLLEILSGCNGVCSSTVRTSNVSGCGCSK